MPIPVKSLGYIKCYSSSSPRPVKSSSNSIRCNCQDLQLIEKTKNHTGNQKKVHIFLGDQQSYCLQVFRSTILLFTSSLGDKQSYYLQTPINCRFFLKGFPVCFNLFVLLFLATPCLVVAVQPCIE